MADYLWGVQDEGGREVVSWAADVERVSDVHAVRNGDTVTIYDDAEDVASGTYDGADELTLHRWPADDKLSDPVSHPVAVE